MLPVDVSQTSNDGPSLVGSTDAGLRGPIVLATWAQAVVNGAILVPWKRTRKVGACVFLGALCIALVVGALMIVVVVTMPYPETGK